MVQRSSVVEEEAGRRLAAEADTFLSPSAVSVHLFKDFTSFSSSFCAYLQIQIKSVFQAELSYLPHFALMDNPPILLRGGTILQHDSNDGVEILHDTDLLIQDGRIHQIGKSINVDASTRVMDCTDKIISPGFVDTHHHVWQTQLKGRHSDDTLFDYHPKGTEPWSYSPNLCTEILTF